MIARVQNKAKHGEEIIQSIASWSRILPTHAPCDENAELDQSQVIS